MALPIQTIYTANADIGLLNAVLNGVAMICNQTAMIWGFAMLAATWRVVTMTTSGALRSANGPNAGTGMMQNSISGLIPFLFAISLTSGTLKTDVQIQSGMTGAVSVVANVPFIISVLPATASIVSKDVGSVVTTAFQGTGTNYAALSASGNGFINPLKTLLTSRTAILKVGGIHSQVNSVVSACLGSDYVASYARLAALVMNAGNTGATSAQSISVFDQDGGQATAIGALLGQAALNPNGFVNDIDVGGAHVVSCYDAAVKVADNINAALYSPEFARAVQGAVNSADVPKPSASFTISTLSSQYLAVRTANTVTNTLAGGAGQANAELINLLFSEMIKTDLDCLKADGPNKTTCLAMAVQGNEIERNNIQAAANGVEGLLYAGQFSNYVTALIIGLGPVIIMFMMFAGLESHKNMKAAAHMIVWPLLIMNVGAELINGMIYNAVANFMTTIAQGGYLTQVQAVEVYKMFSLKVGTASHLIATLPVLMTTIFALGQTASMVKIADSMMSNSKGASDAATPQASSSAPLVTNSSMASASQGILFSKVAATGSTDGVSTSSSYGSLTKEAAHNLTAAHSKQSNIQEGFSNLAAWQKAFKTDDYSKFNLSKSEGRAIKENYENSLRGSNTFNTGNSVADNKSNANASSASVGAGLKVGAGARGFGISGEIGADAKTQTSASDQLTAGIKTGKEKALAESNALSKALSDDIAKRQSTDTGSSRAKSLQKSLSTQQTFSRTLGESKTLTDATSEANKKSANFVEYSGKIGSDEIANHVETNADYSAFQLNQGHQFDRMAGVKEYKDRANRDIENGANQRILGNERAREAAARHIAAYRMASDEKATPEQRFAATEYLLNSAQAMQGVRYEQADTAMRQESIVGPSDRTGVDSGAIIRRANALDPATAPKASGGKGKGSGQKKQDPFAERMAGADEFKDQVLAGQASTGFDVKHDVRVAAGQAEKAGLTGPDRKGTVRRVGGNIAGNTIADSQTELDLNHDNDGRRSGPVKHAAVPEPKTVLSPSARPGRD